jgi:hypothetical protein
MCTFIGLYRESRILLGAETTGVGVSIRGLKKMFYLMGIGIGMGIGIYRYGFSLCLRWERE